MKYVSVFSGIEAASVAWEPLGWTPLAFAEVDPFASAVLAWHYPCIPNLGDVLKHESWKFEQEAVDVFVGGSPCQAFSTAGARRGLEDPRGRLMLTYLVMVGRLRPRWVVWENVPGVLSSGGGRDFGAFLGGLAKLGYGFAYRVLDAQYVRVDGYPRAVPQRRRRVFVVGHLGDARRAAEVLLEPEGVRRNSPPSRKAGKRVAPTLAARTRSGGGLGTDHDINGGLILNEDVDDVAKTGFSQRQVVAFKPSHFTRGKDGAPSDVFPPLSADADKGDQDAVVLVSDVDEVAQTGFIHPRILRNSQSSNQLGIKPDALVHDSLTTEGPGAVLVPSRTAIVQDAKDSTVTTARESGQGWWMEDDVSGTIDANMGTSGSGPARPAIITDGDGGADRLGRVHSVRRLTPRECERLQGFPDDYTLVAWKGKSAPDSLRYKALGNSMAVNVMRWIGMRINQVERGKR